MGSSADMAIHPAFALLVGAVAGTISVFGFAILQGALETHLRLHDTCGVLNLHGMPGIIGGFVSVIVTASFGTGNDYNNDQLLEIYPDRTSRSASKQAKVQVAFIFITLGISIGTGLFSSVMLSKLPYPKKFFLDSTSWETPSREVPYFFDKRGEARHSSEKTAETPSVVSGVVPAGSSSPPAGGAPDKVLTDLQNKVTMLENALRSQRKILRDQSRALEGVTGHPVRTLPESESSMLLQSPRTFISAAPQTQQPSTPSLADMIQSLSRQVNILVESQKHK